MECVIPDCTKTTSDNETKIVFDQPVKIEAEVDAVIVVESEAFEQPNSDLRGFEFEALTTEISQEYVVFTIISQNI